MASNKENDKDLEFTFDDCDNYEREISELYSYTEETEFDINLENFEILLKSKGYHTWNELDDEAKRLLVMHIIQVIEHADKIERFKAITWLLYLVQGVYGECEHRREQMLNCRSNCVLLFKMGVFSITKELLHMEVGLSDGVNFSLRKSTLLSIADSKELRSLLIILYTMVETLRRENESDTEDMKKARQEFVHDLGQNLHENDSLIVMLFNMVVKFCSDTTSNLPMKKILLLIWKLLLTVLGGCRSIQEEKNRRRKEAGLSVLDEDPLQIVREMKASAPPTSASDILEIAQAPKRRRGRGSIYDSGGNSDTDIDGRNDKNEVPLEEEKVTSIDDELMGTSDPVENIIESDIVEAVETVVDPFLDQTNGVLVMGGEEERAGMDEISSASAEPGAMTPIPIRKAPALTKDTASIAAKLIKLRKQQQEAEAGFSVPVVKVLTGLPWIPKARQKDIEAFLNLVRQKFIGFPLPGDVTTEAGLPNPTKDSIAVLRRHQYTPISDLQVAEEAEISKFPMTVGKKEIIPDTLTERLYQSMLPNLPQYMIALLKILLAAAPTSRAKNDSINILSDVLPEEMPNTTVLSMKVGIDVNRHREIIVKAISGIILLLLKHFKLSHVYQFEYASQHLVFANCIPLVLKFFNQNIVAYVTTKNTIPNLEFPDCVIGEKKELTAETLEGIDVICAPCWRNLFSSICLLRILNKLVKWKHSRTMMLVVFKSAPILKRALKVRQAMFQLYVLKLLKVQTKYLGRQWRKSNMKIMSAIYQKVRHRLNDDWAYGNDIDARPWDFQQEECALRAFVERFNLRRYLVTGSRVGGTPTVPPDEDEDYQPVDNNIQNLLREEIELPLDFQKSYDVWLEREVYCSDTDWDQLLSVPCVQ